MTSRIIMVFPLLILALVLVLVPIKWIAALAAVTLVGGFLYWKRVARAGGTFSHQGVTVRSPMFDRWISIDDIKAIALHGEPGLLKVLSRDGGFVMVQIGRNMFERVDIRANRLYQIKKMQQLYAEHDITVSESAATGFGWVLATPMIRRTFVRLSVAETVIVGVTVAVMVFRLAT